jgi:hypothetical protein
MKRILVSLVAGGVLVIMSSVLIAAGSTPSSIAQHKWRFSPTLNAPWALEDDQRPLDSPILAAGR